MKAAHAAAVLTWVYAACFGIPAIPVSSYLLTNGHLPTFFGLFAVYGGPWSSRLEAGTFVALLVAFPPGDCGGGLVSLVGVAGQEGRHADQPRHPSV